MKYLYFAALTLPTVVIVLSTIVGMSYGVSLFEKLGMPMIFGFLPLFNFIVSIALCFVFPNEKLWKIATLLNSVPLILLLLLFTFFWIIGYNG